VDEQSSTDAMVAPTCCCKFGARSITPRSGQASAPYSSQHPKRSSDCPWPLDPPTFRTRPQSATSGVLSTVSRAWMPPRLPTSMPP
jgi:hypothetical protein